MNGAAGPWAAPGCPGQTFLRFVTCAIRSVTFGDARSVWGSNYMSQPRTNEKWTSPSSLLKEQTLLRKELTLFNVLCKASNQESITFWQGFRYALARFPTRFPTHVKIGECIAHCVSSRFITPAQHSHQSCSSWQNCHTFFLRFAAFHQGSLPYFR